MSRQNEQLYQRRSSAVEVPEQEDNEYEATLDELDEQSRTNPPVSQGDPYLAALKYRFPNRPKTDLSYSKPPNVGLAAASTAPYSTKAATIQTQPPPPPPPPPPPNTMAPKSDAYQSSIRAANIGTNTTEAVDGKSFPRPALRRVNPDQQNTYARRLDSNATTPTSTQTKPIGSGGANVRINDQNIETIKSNTLTSPRQSDPFRTQESTFEKVHSQGEAVSYLGTGTFSQFEHCLRECLERERRQMGIASHITRQDIPSNNCVQDFTYDSHLASSHHEFYPRHSHHFIDYPSRASAEFSLDDIRYINVALSRYGIPLLPYPRSYHESCHLSVPIEINSTAMHSVHPTVRHATGEVVSACQLVEDDPALINSRNPI